MNKKVGSSFLDSLKADYPDFEQFMPKLTAARQYVIRKRLKGKTLKEIGRICPWRDGGITPARVREIERRACSELRHWCYRSNLKGGKLDGKKEHGTTTRGGF